MAATALPLKIRVAIRDKWENPASEVQTSITTLTELLGLPVLVDIDWQQLVPILLPKHKDVDTLVPNVSYAVTYYLDTLSEFVDDSEKESWSDSLLAFANNYGRKLVIRVQSAKGSVFKSSSNDSAGAIVVHIPEDDLHPSLSSDIHDSLRTLFDSPSSPLEHESFEHVLPSSALATPACEIRPSKPSSIKSLPALDQLARPEDLFDSQPPYHMIITAESGRVIVQGSHQPSLQLISAYFKKWSRKMRDAQNLSVIKVELRESQFGHGIFFDSVVLEPTNARYTAGELNVMLFVAFAENVLGYSQAARENNAGRQWYLRREDAYV
ncbi:hypothetical protein K461DRAFT_321256 [Myriangium duriaei CBS 260.36]|uniref:Uncharacterized protein n=1 Tax=Myriangium duriaei CBS 260.36 TaxID=1168546 RepID=A0A9P4IZ22_9PEZI|nr:hypothetical protein K461DRAFT_321256 [Myriangium duriaei CBS 260.36]